MDSDLALNGLNIVLCNQSMYVSNSQCLIGHAACEDGTCILAHYVCDGRADCPDNSDEADCSHVCSFSDNFDGDYNCFNSCIRPECVCNELYFHCELGGCVPWSRVCNALLDCPNGEDENMCSFLADQSEKYVMFLQSDSTEKIPQKWQENNYTCINGPNISQGLADDLVPDCPQQDDEKTYYAFLRNGSRSDFFTERVLCEDHDTATCEKNYAGVCYFRHLYCIHEVVISSKAQLIPYNPGTCRNGAHLRNCMMYSCPSFFKCPVAYCVPVHAVCNGKVDCPNGEDEENCQNISCPGFLLCRYDKVCVHPHDVRSGRVKCPVSMHDKALRDVGPCPDQCECLGNGVRCTNATKFDFPNLPQSIRLLIIINSQFTLDDLKWNGNSVALLHMQISFCGISSVESEHFRPLHFLHRLILRNNEISSLPSGIFQTLSFIKHIDIGHNLISELRANIFKGVNILQFLKLDYNKITFIAPCTFEELQNLTTLILSNNYLTDLSDNIFCHVHLSIKELYISGSPLKNVDRTVLKTHILARMHGQVVL